MALKTIPESAVLPGASATSLTAIGVWQGRLVQTLAQFWNSIAYRVNRVLPKDGSEKMTNPLPLRAYTTATRPDATLWAGAIIYVSDGAVNEKLQISNGTSWEVS
jgi:hypothetical protein